MPTYHPLFDSNNRRVFNMSGLPVFARVRNGNVSVTLTATGSWTGTSDGIPNGSVNGSFSCVFTRSSYGTFTPSGTSGHWSSYLGKNSFNQDYWIILQLEALSFSYSTALHKFVLSHSWRAWPKNDPSDTSGSLLGTSTRQATSVKNSSLFVPEGSYVPNWTSYTNSYGSGITLPTSLSLTFNET